VLVRGEVARALRRRAQPLDRVHHVLGLQQEGVAEVLHPRRVLAHHDDDLREGDQRLHARVPWLVVDEFHGGVTLFVRVGARPERRFGDVGRVGGRHQHLRQQRVGEQRDLRGELVDLLLAERTEVVLGPGQRRNETRQCDDEAAKPRE
jgi:hypothetical protein